MLHLLEDVLGTKKQFFLIHAFVKRQQSTDFCFLYWLNISMNENRKIQSAIELWKYHRLNHEFFKSVKLTGTCSTNIYIAMYSINTSSIHIYPFPVLSPITLVSLRQCWLSCSIIIPYISKETVCSMYLCQTFSSLIFTKDTIHKDSLRLTSIVTAIVFDLQPWMHRHS